MLTKFAPETFSASLASFPWQPMDVWASPGIDVWSWVGQSWCPIPEGSRALLVINTGSSTGWEGLSALLTGLKNGFCLGSAGDRFCCTFYQWFNIFLPRRSAGSLWCPCLSPGSCWVFPPSLRHWGELSHLSHTASNLSHEETTGPAEIL